MAETRALLLTDVVDSTKLSEQLGDAAMAALWARHDQVARDLLPAHHGREIDKTDGFLLLFEAASDAVAYALAYHRAIGELGLKARAGLHVGPVILTENAPEVVARGAKPLEVDGVAKPTAARVMSVASGGQTLLTEAARASLGRTALRVESHGHWRMKGIAEPLELFEVGDGDAPFTPPSDGAKVYRVVEQPSTGSGDSLWVPVREVKHSLPAERDAFVGRQADLVTLARRLEGEARLVSVLGIGGTGKTRLITRYGWTWLGDWPGGVWFCDLSEARGVDGIVYAVARALDVPLGKDDPVVQLGHAIAGRGRCLVLLDNFEQVARHADETLGRWLDRAREAQFVVTTREVLGLAGEEALALAPLPAADGAALFVARARSAKRDFEPDDAASIDALVKLLDGLPLAIELAAARVRVMPPKTLLQRMSERFKLLASTGGRHTRQATLRGALDWSWDLLTADEQAALAQLSVFEGGFTLEAAEAVLSLAELWPMDAVQALVDKSLARQVSDERFDLLVSVQEYAAEKLGASGGRSDAEARHAAWFGRLGSDDALDALTRHGGVARRWALARELDNLVAGCRRSVANGDAEPAVALLQAAWEVLSLTGPVHRGLDLAERAATMPHLPPRARAAIARVRGSALHLTGRLGEALAHLEAALVSAREVGDRGVEGITLGNLGGLLWQQGRMDEAFAHLESALVLARELGDRRAEGLQLGSLANLFMDLGRVDEACAHYAAAVAASREVGDRRFEGYAVGHLGLANRNQGKREEAREHFDAALAVAREVGDRRFEGGWLGNLGGLQLERGRMAEAGANYDAALSLAREVGDRRSEGIWLAQLGNVLREQGRMDEARAHGDAALAMAREVRDRRFEAHVLGDLGILHQAQGRADEARAHYDAALALHRDVGGGKYEADLLARLGELHLEQDRLDEARAHLRDGEVRLREVNAPLELAKLLSVRARLEARSSDPGIAHAILTEAADLAARLDAGPNTDLGQALSKARAALETP